jgi:AAHS family 4-hydroxybenzoate transporter-like MFS transporter
MSIRQIVDEGRLSRLQIVVIGVCFFLNMLDGMDVLAISFAAPVIAGDWGISRSALGIAFSAALVGMALGAVVLSPYTDVIGRRKMVLLSTVVITLGMVATALAQSVTQLAVLRLVAGLGIGSMLASLTSMVSEYAPERHRNFSILLLHSAYPVGSILAGIVATWILPAYGWRPLFVLAATVSLVAIPLVFFLMPESLEFLACRQPRNALERMNAILAKMKLPALESLPAPAEETRGASVKALLAPALRRSTLRLWVAFMMGFATLYFLFSWVVKLAFESGLPMEDAMQAGISQNAGAFFGSVTLGYLSTRIGLKRIISIFFVGAAVFTLLYGNVGGSLTLVLVLIFVLMYFVQGGFTGLYAVAARLYPTDIRTTGVGWAIGAGRVGAILGPAAAGFILDAGVPINWTFGIFAVPMILAAVALAGVSGSGID